MQFYAAKDLMELLRVKKSKFYELVKADLAPAFYIGSSPRWTEETVTAWVEQQSAKHNKAVSA